MLQLYLILINKQLRSVKYVFLRIELKYLYKLYFVRCSLIYKAIFTQNFRQKYLEIKKLLMKYKGEVFYNPLVSPFEETKRPSKTCSIM